MGSPANGFPRAAGHHIALPATGMPIMAFLRAPKVQRSRWRKGSMPLPCWMPTIGIARIISPAFCACTRRPRQRYAPHPGHCTAWTARSWQRMTGNRTASALPTPAAFFICGKLLPLLPLWGQIPRQFAPICDRVMWAAIQSRRIKTAHSDLPTVAFRTCYRNHYRRPGEVPAVRLQNRGDDQSAGGVLERTTREGK